MGTITYKLGEKIRNNRAQVYIDVMADRKTHFRLKSGIWVEPEVFDRLRRADRILSLDYLEKFERMMVFPCTKEQAERILERSKGEELELLDVYDIHRRTRVVEKGLSEGTEEMYLNVRRVLEKYLDGRCMSVRNIDTDWLNGLMVKMTSMGLSNSTQLNYWRGLKVFLKYCVENQYLDQKILLYKPHFRQADNDVVYLTHNELYRMMGLELKEKDRQVRDLFVVQCMTGMRYSDMVNIRKENIREDINGKYISILTKKTSQRLKIYLNSTVCEILETYDWTLPHFSPERMNDKLPRIAEKALIEGEVEKVRYVGNRRMVEKKKKYECVTTHCARRTFICLCIENGVSTPIIQSVTGHRQLSSFQRYVGIADKSKSDMMRKLEI